MIDEFLSKMGWRYFR